MHEVHLLRPQVSTSPGQPDDPLQRLTNDLTAKGSTGFPQDSQYSQTPLVSPGLEVRAEVVEGAGVAAQEPFVLVGDAAEHGPQRAGHAVPAHAGPVDVVVRLVGEDCQRVPARTPDTTCW